jgi:hypothetical protein
MPKIFDNGVSFYTHGTANIDIYFPENDVRCVWCPFCRAESDLRRFWCRITNHMVYNPDCAGLPEFCPIKINKETENEKE